MIDAAEAGKMPPDWCCGPCQAGNHAACLSTQPCDCPGCKGVEHGK